MTELTDFKRLVHEPQVRALEERVAALRTERAVLKRAVVAALPRRTAHALHALLVSNDEQRAPSTAAEVCVYDGEALGARATAAALREGWRRGYCVCAPGGYWAALAPAQQLRGALEARYLEDTGG